MNSEFPTTPLGSVTQITAGQSPPGKQILDYPHGSPFHQGTRDFGRRFPRSRTYCETPPRRALPGDVLISVRAPIGRINIADTEMGIGRGLMAVRGTETLDTVFLSYFLEGMESHWGKHESSGSVFANLGKSQLSKVEVPTPPLEEQKRIAATLGALDDKIESNRRTQDLFEEFAFTQFKCYFSTEEVNDGVAISSLVKINTPRKLKKGTPATYLGMSSLPEFSATVFDWETKPFSSGQKFINGDVLMARITPCLENGKTAIVDMLDDGEVGWGSTEYVVLSPSGSYSTAWAYCLIRDANIREFVIRNMSGTSGRQRFNAAGFDEYRIAEPSEESLAQFNYSVVPIFERMSELRDETLRLASLRDALLPELLSGKVRTTEIEDTIEEIAT